MAAGEPILYSLYVYAPNKGAPIFYAVAFAISAVFHIWQCYPLLELSNYHVLGRMFYYVPHCAPFPASKVLATFGGLMLLVETLNSVGASLSANPSASPSQQTLAGHLIIAVLVIQLGVILIFIGMAAVFHMRCRRARVQAEAIYTLLYTLYMSMTLIFIRCIYRLVEHTGDTKVDLSSIEALRQLSPILRYEVFFYIFEATLMLLNSVLWNVWNPGRFLPSNPHVYLAQDGTEAVLEELPDGRSRLAKVANVVTFGILYRKKNASATVELVEYLADNGQEYTRTDLPK